jgi:SulP family sulfate permease
MKRKQEHKFVLFRDQILDLLLASTLFELRNSILAFFSYYVCPIERSVRAKKEKNEKNMAAVDVTKWRKDPGFFASTHHPSPAPLSKEEWFEFVTTTRSHKLTEHWQSNLRAGVTVALVSIPLSFSLSIAGGGTPEQGIVTAFWAGLISSIFGGSHFNIVGPTAALSGILSAESAKHGTDILPFLALYTAMFLFLFLIFRLDKIISYVPTSVSHGFSVGVAIGIAVGRLGAGLGMKGLPPAETIVGKVNVLITHLDLAQGRDTLFFLSQTALMFLFMKRWPKVPWMIFFTAFGIAAGYLLPTGSLTLLNQQFPSIEPSLYMPPPLMASWFRFLPSPSSVPKVDALRHSLNLTKAGHPGVASATTTSASADLSHHLLDSDLFVSAFGAAVVGLLESLLSARIANMMLAGDEDGDVLNRAYSSKRETFGLGLGNLVCAFVGGIPATAALARTALNVRSGAYSRVSTVIGSVVLAVVSLLLLPTFTFLPAPAVASILAITAYRMLDVGEIVEMFHADKKSMFSVLFTAYCSVTVDTFTGLVLGTAVLVFLNWEYFKFAKLELIEDKSNQSAAVVFRTPVTFANLQEVDAFLENVFADYADDVPRAVDEGTFHNHKPHMYFDLEHCLSVDFDGMQTLGRTMKRWRRSILFSSVELAHAEHLGEAVLEVIQHYAEN